MEHETWVVQVDRNLHDKRSLDWSELDSGVQNGTRIPTCTVVESLKRMESSSVRFQDTTLPVDDSPPQYRPSMTFMTRRYTMRFLAFYAKDPRVDAF